jgi:hypothetical protein
MHQQQLRAVSPLAAKCRALTRTHLVTEPQRIPIPPVRVNTTLNHAWLPTIQMNSIVGSAMGDQARHDDHRGANLALYAVTVAILRQGKPALEHDALNLLPWLRVVVHIWIHVVTQWRAFNALVAAIQRPVSPIEKLE